MHELKGQMLLENARADEAVKSYKKADEIFGGQAEIISGIARSYFAKYNASKNQQDLLAAQKYMRRSINIDRVSQTKWRIMSQIYAALGKNLDANIAMAEQSYINGEYKKVVALAKNILENDPPEHLKLRAQDLQNFSNKKIEEKQNESIF